MKGRQTAGKARKIDRCPDQDRRNLRCFPERGQGPVARLQAAASSSHSPSPNKGQYPSQTASCKDITSLISLAFPGIPFFRQKCGCIIIHWAV